MSKSDPRKRLQSVQDELEAIAEKRDQLEADFDKAAAAGDSAQAHEIQQSIDDLEVQRKFLSRQTQPLEIEIRKLELAAQRKKGRELAKDADEFLSAWNDRLEQADALLAEVEQLLAGMGESSLMNWKITARQAKEKGGIPSVRLEIPAKAEGRAGSARRALAYLQQAYGQHAVQVRDTQEQAA